MDSGWMAVWPVAAFFLGGLATQLTGWLNHRRQRAEKAEDASAAFRQRREEFELDHLQRLNEALQVLGRAVGKAHHTDLMTSRQTGHYAGTQLRPEDSDALGAANRDVHMLLALVLNDDLREEVREVHRLLNLPSGMHRSDVDQAESAFARAVLALDAVQGRIAERIREIYLTGPGAVVELNS
ncbi:hypothetical protein GTY83_19100 [Streptomyces sp. SID4928]|uniref:hypothetical protein n=1 Tax=unclassified Streptomyces TaxID=2593676 RepID=UPI0011D1DE06|nr:hypothetical protein [Streptomyces sp. ACT-1]MYR51218.1 hypothetical protein [Streptomyces sp. SID4928]